MYVWIFVHASMCIKYLGDYVLQITIRENSVYNLKILYIYHFYLQFIIYFHIICVVNMYQLFQKFY